MQYHGWDLKRPWHVTVVGMMYRPDAALAMAHATASAICAVVCIMSVSGTVLPSTSAQRDDVNPVPVTTAVVCIS